MPDANYPIPGVAYLSAADSARYCSSDAWLDCSAGAMLRAAARRSPTKWALVSHERRLTYAEMDEATERLGAALLEFPSMDAARRWYDSPEYAPLLAMRLKASKANLVIVEGA